MKWLALLLPVALLQPAAEPTLDTLLDRLSAYLLRYEPLISAVIADEEMTQWDRVDAAFSRPAGDRRLRSEVAFMRLPGDGAWIGFRLVQHVDGRGVRAQQERLQRLLTGSGDDQRRGVAIARESGSYNLGPERTTNTPVLACEFLHPRNRTRLTFERRGTERVDGRTLRRIDFSEHASPTIIQSRRGGDMRAHGSVWIDEATGAIRQTLIRDADPFSPSGFASRSLNMRRSAFWFRRACGRYFRSAAAAAKATRAIRTSVASPRRAASCRSNRGAAASPVTSPAARTTS